MGRTSKLSAPRAFLSQPANWGWIINKLFAFILFKVCDATAECSKTHWEPQTQTLLKKLLMA